MPSHSPDKTAASLISNMVGTPAEFLAAIRNSIENEEPIPDGYRLGCAFKNSRFLFTEDQLTELFSVCVLGISNKLLQASSHAGDQQVVHLQSARSLATFMLGAANEISGIIKLSKEDFDAAISIAGKTAISLLKFGRRLSDQNSMTCLIVGRFVSESAFLLFKSAPNLNTSLGLDKKLFVIPEGSTEPE